MWVGFYSLAGCAYGAARIGALGMIFGDYAARTSVLVMAGRQTTVEVLLEYASHGQSMRRTFSLFRYNYGCSTTPCVRQAKLTCSKVRSLACVFLYPYMHSRYCTCMHYTIHTYCIDMTGQSRYQVAFGLVCVS